MAVSLRPIQLLRHTAYHISKIRNLKSKAGDARNPNIRMT
ncbi:hypothetical protein D1AOALGA4SA_10471 [Olavius algarvensis Delta 1 endosymbiont]|nr:hypothetical protein D1AOALGA4SA_10471 [Olavius algarvensis Delta 1 endosymbiont]